MPGQIRTLPGGPLRIFPQLFNPENRHIVSLLMSEESVTDPISNGLFPELPRQQTHTPTFLQQIYQCASVIGLAMASYFVISQFILQSVQVVGGSMMPTLYDSQQYLLNRWIYYFRAPERNEVVVLRDPIEHGFAVKRIIAREGDQVELKNGKVFVNGHKLEEPYLLPGTPTFPETDIARHAITVGKDQYFVLGDNRNNSADSRTYGLVPRRSILGLILR